MLYTLTETNKIEIEKRLYWIENYLKKINTSLESIEKRKEEKKLPRKTSIISIKTNIRQGYMKIKELQKMFERLRAEK